MTNEQKSSDSTSVNKSPDGRRPHLSITSLNLLCAEWACPLEYVWRYLEGLEIVPTGKMSLGSAVDGALSENFRHKADSGDDLPVEDVVEAFAEDFDARRHDTRYPGREDHDELREQGIALVRTYMKEVAPQLMPRSRDDIQRFWRLKIDNYDFDLVGRIDLVAQLLDGDSVVADHVLVDWKVKGRRPSAQTLAGDLQPTAYWLAFQQEYGRVPDLVRYDVLLRHKEPKVEVFDLDRTEEDVRWFWFLFARAVAVIEQGAFMPVSPGHWKCRPGVCDFYEVCRGRHSVPAREATA